MSVCDWEGYMSELDDVRLPSNCGWNEMRWIHQGRVDGQNGVTHVVRLVLRGQFWDRRELRAAREYRLTDNFEIGIPTVLLAKKSLRDLERRLRQWLDDPSELEAEFTEDEQTLSLRFGESERQICSTDHALCEIGLRIPRLTIECHFVVDQSCIREFQQGLAGWLGDVRQPSE